MIIAGTLWGIITCGGLIYGLVKPHLEKQDDLKRFKEYK
jgi:hypothetical protein